MNGKEYFFRLDALRACAVGGVLLQHFGYWIPIPLGLNLGSYGVQLFFLISGFLITGILKDSFAKKSVRKALWDFYARRFLRIVPIYYLAVFIYVITGMLGVEDSAPYWFYFVNWELFLQGHYLPGTHFWSLAVEEQFYLFWPRGDAARRLSADSGLFRTPGDAWPRRIYRASPIPTRQRAWTQVETKEVRVRGRV